MTKLLTRQALTRIGIVASGYTNVDDETHDDDSSVAGPEDRVQ